MPGVEFFDGIVLAARLTPDFAGPAANSSAAASTSGRCRPADDAVPAV